MIAQVNKLIYNALCQGSDVALPTVGTLVLRRSAAAKSGGQFTPPQRTVTFTGEMRGKSILDIICQSAEVDGSRAEEIYTQWLAEVKQNDAVVIAGVGTIASRTFTADKALLDALNPYQSAAPTPKKRGGKGTLYLLLALITLGVIALIVYLFLNRPEPQVEPVVEPVVEVAPEPEPEPQVAVVEGVERMAEGGNYIVWGVFVELENAKSYKSMLERRYPILDCKIYHHREDTMFLLAVGDGPTRTACLYRMWELQEQDGLFDDMWIFTNK